MWESLFSLLKAGLDFVAKVWPSKSSTPAQAPEETVDATKARAGTAAGAAANTASHLAGKEKPPNGH